MPIIEGGKISRVHTQKSIDPKCWILANSVTYYSVAIIISLLYFGTVTLTKEMCIPAFNSTGFHPGNDNIVGKWSHNILAHDVKLYTLYYKY